MQLHQMVDLEVVEVPESVSVLMLQLHLLMETFGIALIMVEPSSGTMNQQLVLDLHLFGSMLHHINQQIVLLRLQLETQLRY